MPPLLRAAWYSAVFLALVAAPQANRANPLGSPAPLLPAHPALVFAAAGQEAAAPFDVEAATRAYLDRLSPEEKARSDAYFEGGYWLQLWGFLIGLAIAWLLLGTGLSARMRDLAERLSKRRHRKLDPGPLEELLFFDHPSGRARIHMAMQWKAENRGLPPAGPGGDRGR